MKLVLGFAAPLLFGVLFQQFYSFVDTAIVGQFLGASKLAAVGATGFVNFLVIGLCLGFCSGFGIPIAQAFGANDTERLHRCVYHAVLLNEGQVKDESANGGASIRDYVENIFNISL